MESRAACGAGIFGRRTSMRRRTFEAAIETLESRRLLSVTNLIEGASFSDSGNLNPANPSGAVGPANLVNTVNNQIQWFTKAGALQQSETLNDFFASLGTTADTAISDARVIYDQYNQRFVVIAETLSDPQYTGQYINDSHLLIAVSDDSDPNGVWYRQDIATKLNIGGTDAWLDFPQISVSQNAVYVTGNMFAFSSTSSAQGTNVSDNGGFLGSRLWIIPKSPLYSGGQSFVPQAYDPLAATGTTLNADTNGVYNVAGAETLAPAQMYGTVPTGVGTFLTFDDGIDPNSGDNLLGVIRVDNPLGSQPVFTKQIIDVGKVSTKVFNGVPQPWNIGPFSTRTETDFQIRQLTFDKLDANDERILSAVWRNGFLYATQEVIPPTGADAGQVTAHWYQVATGTATTLTAPSLYDQGNIGGEEIGVGVNTFFPVVSVNSRGDMAIGFSASGSQALTNNQDTSLIDEDIFPGAYVTARLAGDPKGTTRPAQALAVGTGLFSDDSSDSATSTWGSFSSVQVDPSDDLSFWAYNMYSLSTGSTTVGGQQAENNWGTRWGKFNAELVDLPAVGNFVWNDLNGNGIQDPGEPGLEGVIFRLYDSSNNLISQTVSDVNGRWYLEGAPTGHAVPGSGYLVVADISGVDTDGLSLFNGYAFSPIDQGNDDNLDSDFRQSPTNPFQATTLQPTVNDLTLAPGQLVENIDLGLFKPFIAISPLAQDVPEGNIGAVHQASFTVTLYTGVLPSTGTRVPWTSPWNTQVYYSTVQVSATSDVDYQSHTDDLVTVLAGQTNNSTDLKVAVYGDTLPEGNETFKVELLNPSEVFAVVNGPTPVPGSDPVTYPLEDTAQILDTTEFPDKFATVTIIDDDLPVVTVDPGPTVVEGSGSTANYALFTIRLSSPFRSADPNALARVNYTLIDGSATGGTSASAGADYDNTSGYVDFAPGEMTKTVRVRVFGDYIVEGNETFSLVISPASTAQLTPGVQLTSTATILDLGLQQLTFDSGKSVTYRDIAGNMVTITLTGPGSGSVSKTTTGEGRLLVLNDTTEQSVLTIHTNHGQAMFGGIQINGGLATLNGASANLNGNLTSTDAIRSLTMNYLTGGQIVLGPSGDPNVFITLNIKRIVDSSLTSETSIKTFKLGSWVDTGLEDVLLAPQIQSIQVSGDFGPTVRPTDGDLGSLTVRGVMRGANIVVTRIVGNQTLGSIGSITAGSIQNSTITAAVKLGSLKVRKLYSNSMIVAPHITTLVLGQIQNTTSDVMVAAEADTIGSVQWVYKKKKQKIKNVDNPGPRGLDKDLTNDPQIILQIT